MTKTRAILRAIFGVHHHHDDAARRRASGRSVMMRVTLDAQHVTPLRRALTRDCAGQPWTIRIATLPHTDRVQLSLYLPKDAVNGAIQQVTRIAPAAQFGHLFEIPDTPTDGWRDLLRATSWAQAASALRPAKPPVKTSDDDGETLERLLSPGNVLLDTDSANRAALFAQLGAFCETHYGVPAGQVIEGLNTREALGSTGLGQGVAVPHSQIEGLLTAVVLYVRPRMPLDFDAPDAKPVSDVIALLVPEGANTMHLNLLADVAQRFCDQHFRERLHACGTASEVCRLFSNAADPADTPSLMPHPAARGDAPSARLRA
ncbi:PTS sugar transporter subunit IIA [Paraburkholderia caribensis]|uniref:PTS sugar transporter subunit IIA n=1 Tax=Paraburkholderia TaxID=1822464 RepID=UPI001CB244CE|nr:PTS sugar transporter subunit IIA [Paraburkholderia caribensis]BEU24297.1 PTS sugar transporter subunit IIA [Paraburkholderia sp. 22B1P]CAG9258644.1 PTS sugar transporter subunit IIA [Paraburkholderia caribensis]